MASGSTASFCAASPFLLEQAAPITSLSDGGFNITTTTGSPAAVNPFFLSWVVDAVDNRATIRPDASSGWTNTAGMAAAMRAKAAVYCGSPFQRACYNRNIISTLAARVRRAEQFYVACAKGILSHSAAANITAVVVRSCAVGLQQSLMAHDRALIYQPLLCVSPTQQSMDTVSLAAPSTSTSTTAAPSSGGAVDGASNCMEKVFRFAVDLADCHRDLSVWGVCNATCDAAFFQYLQDMACCSPYVAELWARLPIDNSRLPLVPGIAKGTFFVPPQPSTLPNGFDAFAPCTNLYPNISQFAKHCPFTQSGQLRPSKSVTLKISFQSVALDDVFAKRLLRVLTEDVAATLGVALTGIVNPIVLQGGVGGIFGATNAASSSSSLVQVTYQYVSVSSTTGFTSVNSSVLASPSTGLNFFIQGDTIDHTALISAVADTVIANAASREVGFVGSQTVALIASEPGEGCVYCVDDGFDGRVLSFVSSAGPGSKRPLWLLVTVVMAAVWIGV